ncbi:hypothetical protein BDV33DRAFT_90595 [Aspergillus novoparasiticus]|uniref:Uncharacterized protein n=1 Tax=Aspergillus novoparasiticus TaxID=986946 RepID=A0A5N6ESR2_9EURO|nr:hypothetical protein BDV33DRAFT_90595 [Aspergillus novoparasiticus]
MLNLSMPLPFFDFIVTIVCSLHMTCTGYNILATGYRSQQQSLGRLEPRGYIMMYIPVFIMTWVVARLTFFLNPKTHKLHISP